MAIGLIGRKMGMMRVIQSSGITRAVSVIKVEPNRIVQTKTIEKDGYNATQVTTVDKLNKKGQPKIRRLSKALKGHYAKAEQNIGAGLWEFRTDEIPEGELDVSLFAEGQFVNVSAKSKGKGFAGVVKRHNFRMQDATHGNSLSHRALGSTGQCQNPGKVFKGKKMPGHMGAERVTSENLKIIKIDNKNQVLLVAGSVPGAKYGFVKVVLSLKKAKVNAKIGIANIKQKELKTEQLETKAKASEKVATKATDKIEKAETKSIDKIEKQAIKSTDKLKKTETKSTEKKLD